MLCHGFPERARPDPSGLTFPQLADRLAREVGCTVLSVNLRGTGESEGDFSLGGWLADVHAAIRHLLEQDVEAVWVAGFDAGGALAICAGGEEERVRGVAAMAAPADFDGWANDSERFLAHTRDLGLVRDRGFPPDFARWADELREIRPLALVGKLAPRPLLLVHGSEDDVVPVVDARALADAAEGEVELRVLAGAGHDLRHDPRALAVLAGWLDRQLT